LNGVDEFLHRLVGQLRIHPQHELIEGDDRNRGEVAPVERNLGRERQHVDERVGDEDLVGIAFVRFHVDQRLGSRRTALERDDHRLFHQIVLLNRGLHHPRHLVGGSAGAGGNDDLHRLVRFPRDSRCRCQRDRQCRPSTQAIVLDHSVLPESHARMAKDPPQRFLCWSGILPLCARGSRALAAVERTATVRRSLLPRDLACGPRHPARSLNG